MRTFPGGKEPNSVRIGWGYLFFEIPVCIIPLPGSPPWLLFLHNLAKELSDNFSGTSLYFLNIYIIVLIIL
jgi:hypothetical protein